MQSNNEAEIAIVMKAKDEASEEMEGVRDQAKGMDKDFNLLSKSMIGTTLGFFGLSFGVTKAVDAVVEARDHVLTVDAAIAVLGPHAEESMRKFEPAIGTIADIVKVADEDVRVALQNILTGSGGIEPTAEQIITSFALASGFGIPIEEAAQAVGQGLGGVMDAINQIVDPSDRNPVDSMDELYNDIVAVFIDSRGTTDDITKAWNDLWNAVTGKNSGASDTTIPVPVLPEVPFYLRDPNSPGALKNQERDVQAMWAGLADAIGLDIFDPTSNMVREGMQKKAGQTVTPGSGLFTDEFGKPIINVIGVGGGTSTVNGGLGLVININGDTSEERRRKILDEVSKQLDAALRRNGGLDGSLGR